MRVGVVVQTAEADIARALTPSLPGVAATLFCENPSKIPGDLEVPLDHFSGLFTHGGVLVATSLATASKILAVPAETRIFYCWDLEWMRMGNKQYHALRSIYANPLLTIVTGTPQQRAAYNLAWGWAVAGWTAPDIGLILEKAGVLRTPNNGLNSN